MGFPRRTGDPFDVQGCISMMYPKIDTLFDRDEKYRIMEGTYRHPEFSDILEWDVTEKIDGTNIRVMIGPMAIPDDLMIVFNGRSNRAQIPKHLLKYLEETYTKSKLVNALHKAGDAMVVVLFMEGYGKKIQSGGNYCGNKVSTRLFDVFVGDIDGPCAYTKKGAQPSMSGWWLGQEAVQDIADMLGVNTVPYIGRMTTEEIVEFVRSKPPSCVSNCEGGRASYPMEGIVARTNPLLLFRNGTRIMFKLKHRDFP